MTKLLRFTTVLAALVALLLGCSKTPEEKAANLYVDAMKKLARFDYEGSLKSINQIGDLIPASPLITAGKAMAIEQHLWTIDAFDPYATIVQNSPISPEGYEGEYRIQKRLRAFDDALITADAYGKIVPKDSKVISHLAEAVLNAGLIQLSDRLIDSAKHVGAAKGETDFLRARAKFMQRKFDSAQFFAASALQEKSSDARYLEVAADYHEACGYADSSILFSSQEMKAVADFPVLWTHHFDRALRLGYFAEARKAMRDVIAKGADSSVIIIMRSEYNNAVGNYVAASNESIHLGSFSPPTGLTHVLLEVEARDGMGDEVQASDALSTVANPLDNTPVTDRTHEFVSSYFYVRFGRSPVPTEAQELVNKIYGPAVNRLEYRALQVTLLYETGRFASFDSLMAMYDAQFGTRPDWHRLMGNLYAGSGITHYDKAKEHYEKALSLDPNYADGFTDYQKTLELFNKYDEAEQLHERFPHFSARYPHIALQKAYILVLNGKQTEAAPVFASAITLRSGDMRAIKRYMDAFDQRFDTQGKQQALDLLVKTAPDNADILALAGEQSLATGGYTAALDIANSGLKLDKDLPVLYGIKARAMYRNGEAEAALHLMDSLYPDNQVDPDFIHQYAVLLLENNISLDKAANFARGAVLYSNYKVKEYLLLIDMYFQMGRYDLSWNEASNISMAYPHRPEGFYRLGRAGAQQGRTDAKEQLQKSIALGLGGPDLDNAKNLISQLK